jgi:hypothetical protein
VHRLEVGGENLAAEQHERPGIAELAEREGIAPSYMTRVLRLTLLAPDIVDGRQPTTLQIDTLLKPFPSEWMAHRKHILDR